MIPEYHKLLMHNACGAYFSDQELEEVISGNLGQDGIAGQNGHPEYHFDDSEFTRSFAYLAEQRSKVIENVKSGTNYREARAAFGRFTHGHQDFYAHSNYVRLWAKQHQVKPDKWTGELDFKDDEIINSPELISGHFYSPWEMITLIPTIGRFFIPLFPKGSHAYLNIDSPYKNAWFPLALKAAELRTRYETQQISIELYQENPDHLYKFLGKIINPFNGV
jgi:hypothetical protein